MSEKRLDLVADLDAGAATALILSTIKFLYDLRERLPMFVVYDHPADHPEHYVARLWLSLPENTPTYLLARTKDLAVLRQFLEACGLVHLDRQPGDVPVVLETWL